MFNENIKPTFLNYIAELEQQDLVGLVTDLINGGQLNEFAMADILNKSGVAIPSADTIVQMKHNLKKIRISYQVNYNGVSIYCEETVDGTSNDDYDDTDEMQDIDAKVGESIAEYAYDNNMTDERGKVRASDAQLEEISRTIARAYLGDVEIVFEVDTFST